MPADFEERLSGHEKLCAERYGNILERLRRLENLVWLAVCAMVAALFALITHKLWFL